MDISAATALVTGGASGLGRAVVAAVVEAGGKAAILDTNIDLAEATAKELGALAVHCDVTDETSVKAAIDAAQSNFEAPIRVAVNCAGIGTGNLILSRDGPMALSDFTRVIDINLNGSFNVMRLAAQAIAAAPPLEDDERGVIISTASVAAYDGQIGQAAYAASKGGIVSLTLPAARELARFGIRVLAVAPGILDTPMADGIKPEHLQKLAELSPYPKRLGHPDEFAALVMHMVENRLLNGEVVRIDGALRLP